MPKLMRACAKQAEFAEKLRRMADCLETNSRRSQRWVQDAEGALSDCRERLGSTRGIDESAAQPSPAKEKAKTKEAAKAKAKSKAKPEAKAKAKSKAKAQRPNEPSATKQKPEPSLDTGARSRGKAKAKSKGKAKDKAKQDWSEDEQPLPNPAAHEAPAHGQEKPEVVLEEVLEELSQDHVAYWKIDLALWNELEKEQGGLLALTLEEGFSLQGKTQIFARYMDNPGSPVQVLTWKKLQPILVNNKLSEFEIEVMVAPRLAAVKQEPPEVDEGTFEALFGDADVLQSQILYPGQHFSRKKTLATAETVPALDQELDRSSQLTQTQPA